ncbi:MAG: hypothetical protein AB7I25_08250 [Vicinamibacterales bacterium]
MAGSDAPAAVPVRWGRILACALAALLVGEAFGQAYFQIWSGQWLRSTALYLWSPYGLVRSNPAATSPQYAINANGFRDLRDYSRERRPGGVRVLLVGGSVLYSGIAETFLESERRVDSASTIAQFLERRLEADPVLAGVDVEVLNAAVNFNRIVEVATAYTGEYAWWDADVVVVFGSANNFFAPASAEAVRRGEAGVRAPHPWRQDFERLANVGSLGAWLEQGIRLAADRSALVTIGTKAAGKVLDAASAVVAARAPRQGPAPAEAGAATVEEEARYFRDYAAVVDGLVATARAEGQDVMFFWEHFLGDVRAVKPLSADEAWLARAVNQRADQTAFHARMRERWLGFMRERGLPHVDPLDRLRRETDTVFIDYLHYTRRGNAIMADEVYDALRPIILARREGDGAGRPLSPTAGPEPRRR